jgi:hypothetical protein
MLVSEDLRQFISSNVETVMSGRQVARIFHGISSPCVCLHSLKNKIDFDTIVSEFVLWSSFQRINGIQTPFGPNINTLTSMS